MNPRIVLDTNVLVAGLRSRRGASYRLLSMVGDGLFEIVLSVPLIMEYETVTRRLSRKLGLTYQDIDDILDYLCTVGLHREIYFLWRPLLRDPKDDLVLELAVESESDFLITHNTKDFVGAETLSVRVITPKQLLETLGKAR